MQLPFDLFENLIGGTSSWKNEPFHTISERINFGIYYPYVMSFSVQTGCPTEGRYFIDFPNQTPAESNTFKLLQQAEFLSMGTIFYTLKESSRNKNVATYQFQIHYSDLSPLKNSVVASFELNRAANTRPYYLNCVSTYLEGFDDIPCQASQNKDHFLAIRKWLEYKFGQSDWQSSGLSFSQPTVSVMSARIIDENAVLLQENINTKLVQHRKAINQAVIEKVVSHASDPLNEQLLYVDAAFKKMVSIVSLAFPELLYHSEFSRFLTALYDKEKIIQAISKYQQNPSGHYIHQILNSMLTTSFSEFKKYILKYAKQAKINHDEEMLEVHYPLVQNTLGWLRALETKHFPTNTPKTYSAVEIYNIYRFDDQHEIALLKSGKHHLAVTNKNGNTALHLAVKFSDFAALAALLPVMRDSLNVFNRYKQSVLDLAMAIADLNHRQSMLVTLIRHGAYQSANDLSVMQFLNTLPSSKVVCHAMAILKEHRQQSAFCLSPTALPHNSSHLMDSDPDCAVLQHPFLQSAPQNTGGWFCENAGIDALLCDDNNGVMYRITRLPTTFESWAELQQSRETFACTPLPDMQQGMHCVGQKVEYARWSTVLVEPTIDYCSIMKNAAISGATYAALPEAIGDLLHLFYFINESNSQRLKLMINILLIMMTGSYLGVAITIVLNPLLKKAGCSEKTARLSANAAAFVVQAGLGLTANTVVDVASAATSVVVSGAAMFVSYGSGRVGLWAEKNIVNKLRDVTEKIIDVNDLVIEL